MLCSKIDTFTLREWQSSLPGTELPTLNQFFYFVTHHCQMLEVTDKSSKTANAKNISVYSNVKRQTACAVTIKSKCNYCQGEHSIYYCKEFLALPVSQKISEDRNRKICFNCLRSTILLVNAHQEIARFVKLSTIRCFIYPSLRRSLQMLQARGGGGVTEN